MVQLALYDYGAGNIFSLKNAFERLGARVDVITDFNDTNYSGMLLPGVGSFDAALQNMPQPGVRGFAQETMPVLGICLGMEMFLESSEEGISSGLAIVSGRVVSLPPTLKVPHMGWNSLDVHRAGILLDGIKQGSWVYYVHSYMAQPADNSCVTAVSDYGICVPAVIERKNYFGTQFHPEKSGPTGRIILENFLRECKK